jgi:hypothetical protein
MLQTNKETTRSGVDLLCMPERDTMVEDRIRRGPWATINEYLNI